MLALRIKKAVRKGATLVVADPRKIWLTKLAKRHLQVRPGTDVWLINAMMHTILEEGLQNEEYIRGHTTGFDAVREVVSRYSPEEAARVTGVDAEAIRRSIELSVTRYCAVTAQLSSGDVAITHRYQLGAGPPVTVAESGPFGHLVVLAAPTTGSAS